MQRDASGCDEDPALPAPHQGPDADDAEITRTRKVRRRFVAEKYAPVIDAFYSGRDEVAMSTSITYEDGRQGTIQSRVHLEDVAGAPAHA